ncbi:MAG TPA: hypothetical protein VNJ07_12560, partial [Chitinophagales bacterium]|nr:hypothetical protein [Chitinophagales bacterium]
WKFVKKSKREAAPHYECVYAKNHVDKMNGNVIKVMERERLVSYTPEELKKIYVTQDYLTMDAYLSNFNKRLALFIKITIRTNNPRSAYGSLFKDAKLIFKLNNGHTVTLHCGQSESGNVDYEHDKTIYMTFFELNDAAIELLQRGKIEMARLYWGKGYEDYKIIIPDFFIRQIHCVK